MTTFYSDHFTDETPNGTVLGVVAKPRVKAPPGSGAATKIKWTTIDLTDTAPVTDDVVRLMTFKTGDRIRKITVSTNDTDPTAGSAVKEWLGTTCDVRFGLFKAGANHDGEELGGAGNGGDSVFSGAVGGTPDLLAANGLHDALVFMFDDMFPSGAHARMSITELWRVAAFHLTAVTLTEDPHEDWDIAMLFRTVTALTQAGEVMVIVDYIPAGGG